MCERHFGYFSRYISRGRVYFAFYEKEKEEKKIFFLLSWERFVWLYWWTADWEDDDKKIVFFFCWLFKQLFSQFYIMIEAFITAEMWEIYLASGKCWWKIDSMFVEVFLVENKKIMFWEIFSYLLTRSEIRERDRWNPARIWQLIFEISKIPTDIYVLELSENLLLWKFEKNYDRFNILVLNLENYVHYQQD